MKKVRVRVVRKDMLVKLACASTVVGDYTKFMSIHCDKEVISLSTKHGRTGALIDMRGFRPRGSLSFPATLKSLIMCVNCTMRCYIHQYAIYFDLASPRTKADIVLKFSYYQQKLKRSSSVLSPSP